ncbi:MAG TPA: hypothetical protein PLA94_26215 [Myxococcota bacterium]|nr:hypothetical protein [Myxococcota bacterium]
MEWIQDRGYEIVLVETEREAAESIRAVAAGRESYRLMLVDVMLAAMPLDDLQLITEEEACQLPDPAEAGARLVKLAREDLHISSTTLPIVVMTYRSVDVGLKNRFPSRTQIYSKTDDEGLRRYLEVYLPV